MIEYPKVQQTGPNKWKLSETIRVYSEFLETNIAVMRGFCTDFASVPRMFWSVIPPFGKYSTAAVVHDRLYKNNCIAHKKIYGDMWLTRKECDKVFEELLIKSTCKKWKRKVMYRAVRLGGWNAWRKHRRNNSK